MNFKINNKGLGIVEVLLASFIGLILVGALTKTSISQLKFYNAIQSLFDEQDLAYSMGEVLTNDLSCKANLKPSHLNNGDTTALVQGLGDPDVQDMSLVTAGTNFKSLNIVKINLSGSGDPETQTVSRDLTVFFKRKGSFSTRDNKPCSSTNTSGCYATKCVLKYRVSSSDVTVCDVQTCAGIKGGINLSGIKCNNNGGYLVGFDNQGQKICKDLYALVCPPGEYLRGVDVRDGSKICETMPTPPPPTPRTVAQQPEPEPERPDCAKISDEQNRILWDQKRYAGHKSKIDGAFYRRMVTGIYSEKCGKCRDKCSPSRNPEYSNGYWSDNECKCVHTYWPSKKI